MTHLIVTHEDDDVDEFRFDPEHSPISLGRRTTNDVCIASPSVSGSHAMITIDGDGAWIEDRNSTNGTFINGRLISRRRLEHGDEITIGKARVTWLGWSGGSRADSTHEMHERRAAAAEADSASENQDPLQPYAERLSARTGQTNSRPAEPPPQRRFDDLFEQDADDDNLAHPSADDADGHDTAVARRPVTGKSAERASPAAASSELVEPATTQAVAEASAPDSAAEESVGSPVAEPVAEPVEGADGEPVDQEHPLDRVKALQTAAEEPADAPLFDVTLGKAAIEIRNGAKSGQTLQIDKPVTTLGRPGIQIAAIMRKPDGYFLMHVESDDSVERPTLNDDVIGDDPVPLRSGDQLKVAGVDVQFRLT